MADLPEYKRFSIYSKKDPSSGAYAISDYEKDRRNFINNALKSALPEGAYVQVSSKSLAKTGQERIDIYVHKEDANLVGKSLSGLGEQMKHKGSIEEKYHVTKARPVDEDQSKALYADEKARAKALENEQKESYRFNKGSLIKIFSTLLAIANIARRILTATLNNVSQSAKDMVTAHNLGLSYRTVREARFTEEALGVREGVITEGITDVQTAFGNITKLDEKTLEDLAVVMGSQVEEMIKVATAGQDPEKAMSMILDAFNARANAGYNSVGQYVGEQQARRELYSYLLRLSPAWADIFASMQEEQNNINSIYKNIKDYTSWKNAIDTNRGNLPQTFFNVEVTTSKLENQVKAIFDEIKKGLLMNFDPLIASLLRRLANVRWGLSASENAQMNRENTEANKKYLTTINNLLSDYEGKTLTKGDEGFKIVLEKEKKKVEEELEAGKKGKDVANFTRTVEELRLEGGEQTYSLLAFGGIKSKYTDEESQEAIRRAVKNRLAPETIESERIKIASDIQKSLEADKLKDKKKQYKALYNQYLSEGMSYYYANKKIAEEHPELLQVEKIKRKAWNGKEIEEERLVETYKTLTDEESAQIFTQARESVDEQALLLVLLRKYGKNLNLGQELKEMANEAINNTPMASLYTLYQENPDWAKNISTKWAKEYSGYGAKVISRNDYSGNEVVHKIVLDVNNNGEADAEDIVLGSFMGMEGANADLGELIMTINGNKKPEFNIVPAMADGASKTLSAVQD